MRVWWSVDLPIMSRALAGASAFAFAVALGEFGATTFIARPETPDAAGGDRPADLPPGSVNAGMALAAAVVLAVLCAAVGVPGRRRVRRPPRRARDRGVLTMLEMRGVDRHATAGDAGGARTSSLEVPDGAVLALLGPVRLREVDAAARRRRSRTRCRRAAIRWDGADLAGVPGAPPRIRADVPGRCAVPAPGRRGQHRLRPAPGRAAAPEIDVRVEELLELVGLPGYGARRVATLSGGEAQRVALARALAPRPRLLLLDEPLAALDRSLRERLLADLRSVLTSTGTTAVFVTHDQARGVRGRRRARGDARRAAIGRSGPPREVWPIPADDWVAGFVGYTSVLDGRPRPAVSGRMPRPAANRSWRCGRGRWCWTRPGR